MTLSVTAVTTVWLTGVTGDPVSKRSDNCLVDGGHW